MTNTTEAREYNVYALSTIDTNCEAKPQLQNVCKKIYEEIKRDVYILLISQILIL